MRPTWASAPGTSVTSTVPGPVIRPVPRITVTPARASRRAGAESSRPPVTSSRRATASSQVFPRAAESSSEFDGRQARYGRLAPDQSRLDERHRLAAAGDLGGDVHAGGTAAEHDYIESAHISPSPSELRAVARPDPKDPLDP